MPRHHRIFDASTGETTNVDFTPEEERDWDEMEVVQAAKLTAQVEADEQAAALKTSGKAKLVGLGLTDDEIDALTG
jgi:hypothetical protein